MMANLMGGGNGTGGAGPAAGAEQGAPDLRAQEAAIDKEIDALSKQLQDSGIGAEDFLKQLLSETVAPVTQEQKDSPSGATKTAQEATTGVAEATSAQPESFQDTIRRTMQRMQESGDRATAEATEEGNDDMISQLLKAIEAGAGSGGDDMDLNKMFLGMMQQLSNKDLLYEPIKELDGKFGPWLEENKDKVPAEDMVRYQTQARVVREIVAKFDEEGYSDDKPECRTYIWDRMQEVFEYLFSGDLTYGRMLTVSPTDASRRQSAGGSHRKSFNRRTQGSRWRWTTSPGLPDAVSCPDFAYPTTLCDVFSDTQQQEIKLSAIDWLGTLSRREQVVMIDYDLCCLRSTICTYIAHF